MTQKRPDPIPCAIYTRKSSEEGLEQAFNSLDAQREAAEAFIQSQRHEGWTSLADRYDDGGISGATMERPALKQLLDDIETGKVAVVVVYKVDRLTRALSDFAKMIDLFDRHGVSFVSVTQQFNTTSSMGRLTLNVLLSFAQFEREVTGERIRDKIAASKKKGMWMGGIPPLGYDIAERKLVANPEEAEIVRWMFQHYLQLGSINRLRTDVVGRGITTKTFTSETGRHWGGGPFGRSALHRLLGNPIYIGHVAHKGNVYPGEHDGIVDRDLWDQVQATLQKHRRHEGGRGPAKQASLLKGLIFDAAGERLTPVHANKRGMRYRYYVSHGLISGASAKPKDGVWRIPAHEIEQLVVNAVKDLLKDRARLYDIIVARDQHLAAAVATYQRLADLADHWAGLAHDDHRALLASVLSRIVITSDAVDVHVCTEALLHIGRHGTEDLPDNASKQHRQTRPVILTVSARLTRCGTEMKIVLGNEQDRPPRPDTRLITVVARAHRWHDLLMTGKVGSIKELARIEERNERHLGVELRLAFLAPDIVETILAGKQPPTLMAEHLIKTNLPLGWDDQRRVLGFTS